MKLIADGCFCADLSLDARLLYVSTSIEDILGYAPQEVIGKSCWEYFHPDEIPFAQSIHGRSIQLDKAAVLNYCKIKNKWGRWVGCECVFTITHDVLVASTSVYRRGLNSQSKPAEKSTHPCECHHSNHGTERAKEAPIVRQLFSSSPRDPRYHMLSYISHKFSQEIRTHTHEPRAALFLNCFSRTLTIMYATNGLADLLGISADQLTGKSFYYCIQENCLREAVKCLESAKANDSIAYLRFWFRDPRQEIHTDHDEPMSDGHSSGDDDDGGVNLSEIFGPDGGETAMVSDSSNSTRSSAEPATARTRNAHSLESNSRSSSGNSTDGNSNEEIFDQPVGGQSRTSSVSTFDERQPSVQAGAQGPTQVELEAVVSCTSDGLVVVLRRARPFIPHISHPASEPAEHPYVNGFFASPWANDPIVPNIQNRSNPLPNSIQPTRFPLQPTAAQANTAATKGPATEDFMNSIREVAVFAWSLTGINGSLAQYSRGTPTGESQPPGGLPIWDPSSQPGSADERRHTFDAHGQSHDHYKGFQKQDQMQIYNNDTHMYQVNSRYQQQYTNPAPSNDFYDPMQNTGVVPGNDAYNSLQTNVYHPPGHPNRQSDQAHLSGHGNPPSMNGYYEDRAHGNVAPSNSYYDPSAPVNVMPTNGYYYSGPASGHDPAAEANKDHDAMQTDGTWIDQRQQGITQTADNLPQQINGLWMDQAPQERPQDRDKVPHQVATDYTPRHT